MSFTFDYNETLSLVKGGLLDHRATWERYLGENPGWMRTAAVLTGPLLVFNVVLSAIFSRLVGGYSMYAVYGGFWSNLFMGLGMAAVGVAVATAVLSFRP